MKTGYFKIGSLILLAVLIAIKFVIIPVYAWQVKILDEISFKSHQHSKLSAVISNQPESQQQLANLKRRLEDTKEHFYVDSPEVKLNIQKQIESIFGLNDLTINSFSWILDNAGEVRVLRASVKFSGSVVGMIKTFWDIHNLQQFVLLVDWRQQVIQKSPSDLGETKGSVSLEFYALSAQSDEHTDKRLVVSGLANTDGRINE